MLPFDPLELDKLRESEPEKYREVIARLAREMKPDDAKQAHLEQLAIIAGSGTGHKEFLAFYEGIHGNQMLPHNVEANLKCEQAFDEGKIFLYHAARGFRKTSTFIVTKAAFLIGHHPSETSIFTGASEENPDNITKSIAAIIEHHPFFKMVFPHVVIHKEMGWGADGYWIRDNSYSIEDWTKNQAKTIDPTFVGGGYKSRAINGKHPTLILGVDDLHDINSSKSSLEREDIKEKFLVQILKSVIRKNDKLSTRIMMTGVPFSKDDTYAVLRESGGVIYHGVPAMVRANQGEGVYIDGVNEATGRVYDDIVGWWHLTCPEIYGVKSIIEERAKGKAGFYQMLMLDIDSAKNAGLRYYTYDHKKLSVDLPTTGGADPTSIEPDREVGGKKRSSFALCFLSKLLTGGACVRGGVLKPMGIEEAKLEILKAQSVFRKWLGTHVEDSGAGKVVMQYFKLDSRLMVFPSNLRLSDKNKKGIANKLLRFEYEVAPHLESGALLISDEDTDYLNALRAGLDNFFDLDEKKSDERLDAMDALFHAAKSIPDVFRQVVTDDISPDGLSERGGLWHPLMGAVNGRR